MKFINYRRDDPAGAEAWRQQMREVLGEEAFACWQRSNRLEPEVRDDRAVWTCWQTGQVIWPIGELAVGGDVGLRPDAG